MIQSARSVPTFVTPASRPSLTRSSGRNFANRLSSIRTSERSAPPRADPGTTIRTIRTARPSLPDNANPNAASQGFVRAATDGPAAHLPRFETVPAGAQWPQGPYKQAPADAGGEWWLVNPFTGPEPWTRVGEIEARVAAIEDEEPPPADFLRIFGPRPERSDSASRSEHSRKIFVWERELNTFEGVGTPDGMTQEQIDASNEVFESWGMGEPAYYKGRHGWAARFPEARIPEYQSNPESAIQYPHLIIANYQVREAREGLTVANPHPLVPPWVFSDPDFALNA